jgi:transcriptional regulator with XRE-family HTH domain
MQVLIGQIRHFTGLTQLELAKEAGIAAAAINRWENGKAYPNQLSQNKLSAFCKERSIPICDMILQRIQQELLSLENEAQRIILFYASKPGIEGKIASMS